MSGDIAKMESISSQEQNVYMGLAFVIIRSKPGGKGPLTVTAKSDGLVENKVAFKIKTEE